MAETTTAPELRTYVIPAIHLDELSSLFAKANGKLARWGIDGLFTWAEVSRTEVPTLADKDVTQTWVTVAVTSAPVFALGDYVFVASLVAEDAGMVVHTAPGQTLEGWTRPAGDDQTCEHCNVARDRKHLYVVRNVVTGEVVQVGSTCIEAFLGVEVKGLGMLEFLDSLDEIVRGFEGNYGAGRGEFGLTVPRVLSLAWVLSKQGRGYISVSNAQAWDKTPTGAAVRSHGFYGAPNRAHYRGTTAEADYQADLAEYIRNEDAARAAQADEALMAAIIASAETVRAGSDYGDNLRIIVQSEAVRDRNVGILASLVAVYARELNLRAEAAAKPAPVEGFLAPVKDAKGKASRLRGLQFTVTRVRYLDGDYGTTTILVGTASTGHAVEWFASGHISADEGDVITLDASVKAHRPAGSDKYTRVDTTVLTRGKIASIATPGDEDEAPEAPLAPEVLSDTERELRAAYRDRHQFVGFDA